MTALPRLPYVVIDMNQCRKADVVADLMARFDRDGTQILLPAVASHEMSKGGTTGSIFATLEHLAARPEAVIVGRHSLALKGEETKFRRPVSNVTDVQATAQVRDIMAGMRAGDDFDESGFEEVRSRWRGILHRESNASIIRQLEHLHRKESSRERTAELRRSLQGDPSDPEPMRRYIHEALEGADGIARFLVGVDYGHVTASKLARFPSFSALLLLAMHALALRWRLQNGIDLKPGLDPVG